MHTLVEVADSGTELRDNYRDTYDVNLDYLKQSILH